MIYVVLIRCTTGNQCILCSKVLANFFKMYYKRWWCFSHFGNVWESCDKQVNKLMWQDIIDEFTITCLLKSSAVLLYANIWTSMNHLLLYKSYTYIYKYIYIIYIYYVYSIYIYNIVFVSDCNSENNFVVVLYMYI